MKNIDFKSYRRLGAHIVEKDGKKGVRFCVWAPNAQRVSVVGDFNEWISKDHEMNKDDNTGEWSLFIEGLKEGDKIVAKGVAKLRGDTQIQPMEIPFDSVAKPVETLFR